MEEVTAAECCFSTPRIIMHKMAGFDDYADALRLDDFLDGFGDLGGEALLNLQAAGEQFDQARNFAEADDFAVGNVGDVHFAEERAACGARRG